MQKEKKRKSMARGVRFTPLLIIFQMNKFDIEITKFI